MIVQVSPETDELYVHSLLLSKVVERVLQQRGGIELSDVPMFEKTPIVEFMKRMRVWSLEKFNDTTYISAINFFKNDKDLKAQKTLGTILIYIEEEYISYLFKRLDYPNLDEDDDDCLKDACGTFCNIIAAKFKSGLAQMGYAELSMSHFYSFKDEVFGGVAYDTQQKSKYEIAFEINGVKRIVAELTLGKVPKY